MSGEAFILSTAKFIKHSVWMDYTRNANNWSPVQEANETVANNVYGREPQTSLLIQTFALQRQQWSVSLTERVHEKIQGKPRVHPPTLQPDKYQYDNERGVRSVLIKTETITYETRFQLQDWINTIQSCTHV